MRHRAPQLRRPRASAAAAAATLLVLAVAGCSAARELEPRGDDCAHCHGSSVNDAPPPAVGGSTSTSDTPVGAHQLHVRDTPIRSALDCSECHVMPRGDDPPWHFGDAHGTVTFGPLATARNATPAWDRTTQTCSGVYCHGAKMRSPPPAAPVWTFDVAPPVSPPSAEVCGKCHGYPPPAPHPALRGCAGCHPLTVASDGTIDVAGGHHVDGRLDVRVGSGACDLCHGYPPEDSGHLAHAAAAGDAAKGKYGSTTILQDLYPQATPLTAPAAYGFGCGNCHPLDDSHHMDGTVDLELANAAAPEGSLKARAEPSARYAGGTCSGVYCHSSGQQTPRFMETPAWASGAGLACSGCHDNPPRYASGGAAAADANSHLVLAGDGYESGHFGGFPSAWHAGNHGVGGGLDASAITCQTCHFDTVDPRNTGPSGFYYLDTTGDYRLPGGKLDYACADCHAAGGTAPPGSGRALPLRHVNGARDVVFDARPTLPPYAGLPAAPNTPTRPYWTAPAGLGGPFPPGMGYDGTTLSTDLAAATFTAATKTCSNVACHLDQTSVAWGGPQTGGTNTCSACHSF